MLVNPFRCNLHTSGESLYVSVWSNFWVRTYVCKSSSIVHINVVSSNTQWTCWPKENTAPCWLHSPQLQCRIPTTDVLGKQDNTVIWLQLTLKWHASQPWTLWLPMWMRSPPHDSTRCFTCTMAIVGRSVSTGCGPWETQRVWHVMRHMFTFTLHCSHYIYPTITASHKRALEVCGVSWTNPACFNAYSVCLQCSGCAHCLLVSFNQRLSFQRLNVSSL